MAASVSRSVVTVATTTVECPKKFTVTVEETRNEEGELTWWVVRGSGTARGSSKIDRIERWVLENLADHTEWSAGDYGDWHFHGRGTPDLDALVDFAVETCTKRG